MSANTMAIAATYFMAAPRIGLLILDAGLPSSSTSANLIMRLGLGRERIVSARRSSLSAMVPPRPAQPRHAILGMETMLVRFHRWLKFIHGVGDVHQMLQQHTRSDWSKRFRTLVRNRLRGWLVEAKCRLTEAWPTAHNPTGTSGLVGESCRTDLSAKTRTGRSGTNDGDFEGASVLRATARWANGDSSIPGTVSMPAQDRGRRATIHPRPGTTTDAS